MPNDWNEQSSNYSIPLSPMLPMSTFASESGYCYSPVDYSHTYTSSAGQCLSSNQLINSLSYQNYHHQPVTCQGQLDVQQQLHHEEEQQAPSYSYLDALTYSTHNIKLESINSGSSEVTSTSSNEPRNESVRSASQVVKSVRRGNKSNKAISGLLKGTNHHRRKNKPELSYATIIWMAINRSPSKKLTLSEIYDFMLAEWPQFFAGEYVGWKNSVRHNLSLNECFVRVGKEKSDFTPSNKSSNKGSYWVVADHYKGMFDPSKGYQKRRPRNFRKLVAPTKKEFGPAITTHLIGIADGCKKNANASANDFYAKTLGESTSNVQNLLLTKSPPFQVDARIVLPANGTLVHHMHHSATRS